MFKHPRDSNRPMLIQNKYPTKCGKVDPAKALKYNCFYNIIYVKQTELGALSLFISIFSSQMETSTSLE